MHVRILELIQYNSFVQKTSLFNIKGEIMGGKSLILLGLGAGALYTYFCITTHKDQLYEKLYPAVATADIENNLTKNEVIPSAQDIVKKENPSFTFINSQPLQFNALLDKNAKQSKIIEEITKLCQSKKCNNDIKFEENIKEDNWSNESQALVIFMIENNIKDGSVTVNDGIVKISGDLQNNEQKEKLTELLNAFDNSLEVQNVSTVSEPSKKDSNDSNVLKEPTNDDKDKIKEAQEKINSLLKNTVIHFQLNSSKIVPSSQKVLDNIIQIINDLNTEINITVAGHSDASGSASYNKTLSQKRADSVKSYLIKHKLSAHKITATGYGEEKLLFSPHDKRNRRVDITLKKGN